MHKKIMLPVLGLVATALIATLASTALAVEKEKGRCTLTNGTIVNIEGPCEFFQEGDIVNVQGTAEENGVTYIATIDNSKNEGLLIGAGTFDLATGKLEKNEATEVAWPNGYVLKINPK